MSESVQTWALAQAERLSGLSSRAWIDATADGLVAFLLIAPSSAAVGLEDIGALATAVGLAGPAEPMPSVGERVVLHGLSATVQLPEIGRALRVAVTSEWSQLVREGGTVAVLLAADPLAEGATKAERDDHLLQAVSTDRLWLGKAVRFGWTGSWVRCGTCARCVSGTARHPNPGAPDCYDVWLSAATDRRSA